MDQAVTAEGLLQVLDLIGTCVFALSGATLAVRARMDVFGVLVLAVVTAVSGGIIRDLLIGIVPPMSIANWQPVGLAVVSGALCFQWPRLLERLAHPVQFFDATGLGVFAVSGAQIALDHGLNAPMAAVLGMLSGIGGGMVRDVLMARVPVVLRSEIYALAALVAAVVVVAGHQLGISPTITTPIGAILCVFLRIMAIYRGWRLPQAGRHFDEPPRS